MCAKTGTAENYLFVEGRRTKLKNNSIFVCFAPRENPQIAVAVVIQNAGYGATWAAPIGSLLVEKYLRDTLTQARVEKATMIANTNLMPGYLIRLQYHTDSLRAISWAKLTHDSTRLKRYQDPAVRRELMDTLHKPTIRVTIPFGPKPRPSASSPADTARARKGDSALLRRTGAGNIRKPDSLKLHKTDSGNGHRTDSAQIHRPAIPGSPGPDSAHPGGSGTRSHQQAAPASGNKQDTTGGSGRSSPANGPPATDAGIEKRNPAGPDHSKNSNA
jgi:hypothetical protein